MQLLIKIILIISFIGLLAFTPSKNSFTNKTNYNTYLLDTATSKIHWNCGHYGYLKFKTGELIFNKKEPIQANFTINMASITNSDINNKLLQGTLQNVLKSDVFFDVKKYPNAYFESDLIRKIDANNYEVIGDFIIFDTGFCHDFKATITLKNDSVYFNTATIILDRTEWGIYYGSAKNLYPKEEENGFRVTDSISLDAHIVALKK